MTLRRQLFLGISLICLMIFIGMAVLGISGTRAYLEEQLGSHAQDAASSLVHPLSQSLGSSDDVLAETQIATLFDRGYFQRIAVFSADGTLRIDRQLPAKIDGVPLWFSQAVTLHAPPGESFISAGWRQLGKVVVISQPTYAYQYLWSSALEISGWMLAAYLLAIWLTHLVLGWILNPLSAIERSAIEIQQRRFEQISIKPKALELARVVLAMNNMSRKISEFLDIETRKAEKFRREAYQDDLTGLDNRRSFDLRLAQVLNGEMQYSEAALIGVEVNNLKSFNTEASYSHGDRFLKAIADSAKQVLGEDAAILCRIGGAAFGFVLLDRDLLTLTDLGRRLRDQIDQTCAIGGGQIDFSFSMGMVNFHQGESRARLLSRLDLAIESARQSGHNTLQYVVDLETSESSLGSLAWRDLIRNALTENRWTLLAQPVVSLSSGQVMQQEVMTRLVGSDGHLVPASVFLPMAMRHKLMPDIDQALLSLVFARMEQRQETVPINLAVNLSNQSLENRDFMNWLAARLDRLNRRGFSLAFELTEYGCSLDLEASRRFAAMLRSRNVGFGIDHFGLAPGSLQLLRDLPPDYVKLNAGLISEAPGNDSAHALVRSIVSLASSLDVEVIAQGVENASQVELLFSDVVQGGQGYYFGAPTAERI